MNNELFIPQVVQEDRSVLLAADEEGWKKLLDTFLNSQDIMEKSRETYRWGLERYFYDKHIIMQSKPDCYTIKTLVT